MYSSLALRDHTPPLRQLSKQVFVARREPTGAQLSRSQQSACVNGDHSAPATYLFISRRADS